MVASISSPLLSSSIICSPTCRCSTSRSWCASSPGNIMSACSCRSSSGATKKRCILFPHYERDPVIDHHLFDQRQASRQQWLFGFVFALLYNATGNQKAIGSQYLRQLWSNRADHTRNDIRQHEVKLSLQTCRFSLIEHAQHNGQPVAQGVGCCVSCRALNGHAAIIDAVDAGRAKPGSRQRQYARTRTNIQRAHTRPCVSLDLLEAHARSGMQTRAKGHTRIEFQHNLVMLRGIFAPRWANDQPLADVCDVEIVFPGIGPILFVDDARL